MTKLQMSDKVLENFNCIPKRSILNYKKEKSYKITTDLTEIFEKKSN